MEEFSCWICEEEIKEKIKVIIEVYNLFNYRRYCFHKDCIGDLGLESYETPYVCGYCGEGFEEIPCHIILYKEETQKNYNICKECWDRDFGLET